MSSAHGRLDESAWPFAKSAEVPDGGGRNDERLAAPNNDEQLEHTSAIWQSTGKSTHSPSESVSESVAAATSTEPDSEQPNDQSPGHIHRRTSSQSSSLIVVGSREDDHFIEEDWDSLEENDIAQAQHQSEQSSFSAAYFGSEHNPESHQAANEDRKPAGFGEPRDRSHFATARPVKRNKPVNMESEGEYHDDNWQQAGEHADAQDLAGPGLHGRVECTVTDARKENEGTQNQYISYLVTTNVSTARTLVNLRRLTSLRPTSNRFSPPTSLAVDASQTLFSSTRPSVASIRNAPSRQYRTSTRWSTFEETGSVRISRRNAHIHSVASSDV